MGPHNSATKGWGITSTRLEKLTIARKADTYPEECFFKINFLCLTDEAVLSTALNTFQYAASALQSGWVYKPNADEDLLPRSPRSKPFVTAAQRDQLFQCLLCFITSAFEQAKECQIKSAVTLGKAKSLSDIPRPVLMPQHVVERHIVDEQLDDAPAPFRLGAKDEDLDDVSKRSKGLPDDSASHMIIDAVDSVPVVTP